MERGILRKGRGFGQLAKTKTAAKTYYKKHPEAEPTKRSTKRIKRMIT